MAYPSRHPRPLDAISRARLDPGWAGFHQSVTTVRYDNHGGGLRDRRCLVRIIHAEDVVMNYDTWMPVRFSGRDVALAWILAALLFLGFAFSM